MSAGSIADFGMAFQSAKVYRNPMLIFKLYYAVRKSNRSRAGNI